MVYKGINDSDLQTLDENPHLPPVAVTHRMAESGGSGSERGREGEGEGEGEGEREGMREGVRGGE